MFGLGDSGYSRYNFAAKLLYKRLLTLGATSLIRRGDGDEQHPIGLYGELIPWLEELCSVLLKLYPLPEGKEIIEDELPQPRYIFSYLDKEINQDDDYDVSFWKKPPETKTDDKIYHQWNPYYATMVKNERITSEEWEQDVRHIEFDIGSDLVYNPGDVVYIKPRNSKETVNAFISLMNLDKTKYISNITPTSDDIMKPEGIHLPMSIEEFVASQLDISGQPKRYFFELLSHFATNPLEKERLKYFSSPEGQGDMYDYVKRSSRSCIDVLKEFSSARPPFEYIVDIIPRLQARPFTISSAQSIKQNILSISMVVVRYKSRINRIKKGVCSNWLANLSPDDAPVIPIWISKGTTTLPPNHELPLIMVGPGTGCSLFRAFLQEYYSKNITSSNRIFFFGCRHKELDFLYRSEWELYVKMNILSMLETAFSRDQPNKVYVQHLMEKRSKLIWDSIKEGGYVYICGNGNKMPTDVRKTIIRIISKEGNMSEDEAEKFLKDMEVKGKYLTETWF